MFKLIRLRSTLFAITVSLSLFSCGSENNADQAASANSATAKAIFIIVDGIPADVIENTASPNIDSISRSGGYTRAYVGGEVGKASESPTVSAVGYQSLITGTWANKHNIYNNSPDAVNYDYWDIFRLAKSHDPEFSTALFSTWLDNRTVLIGDGIAAAGGNKLDYYFDGFETDLERFPHDEAKKYIQNIDELVSDEAARYIEETGPDLSWVYLQHTDDVGHKFGDSPEQQVAVEWIDERVGVIWNSVKQRSEETGEDWLIVVTTDHGRDEETGKHHGRQSERERTIWIATNSRKLNEHFGSNTAIVDILPSIATHLRLAIPEAVAAQLDGQSFISR